VDVENEATKEEKYKNKVKKQFQEIKNTEVTYGSSKDIVNIINGYEDVDAYYKRMKDVTENILGDYEEGDKLPAKYLHIASRVNPTIGGNYVCEESDGYLFCMDHFKRMYELIPCFQRKDGKTNE
jgi:ribosomal protein S17E